MFTNFRNGVSSMGIPLPGGAMGPVFGRTYFVDGTNGNDANSGRDPSRAKATIQAALTLQIADAVTKASLGDVIYVLPGTYAESITGNMTKVQIIGVGRTGVRPLAKIHPTTSYAYTGEMTDAGFKNLEFVTPTTSNKTYPAICITGTTYTMVRSFIDHCFFYGGVDNDVAETTGICIGTFAAGNSTYEYMETSEITNCVFGAVGGRKHQFSYALTVIFSGTSPGGTAYKGMSNCLIAGNRFSAKTSAILINTAGQGNSGSVIVNNIIGSQESTTGPTYYGIGFANADELCMVIGNHINANTGAIYNGGTAGQVLENWVAVQGVEGFLGTFTSMGV